MNFKYTILPFIICTSMVTASAMAEQADGTVNITGKIVEQTCEVDSDSKNLSVTLPTISTNSLNAPGVVGGATPFKISIKGCLTSGENLPKIGVYFSGINVDNASGTLNNIAKTSSVAENVNVQLLNKDMTEIDLTKGKEGQTQTVQLENNSDTVTFNFGAQYYATGKATPGDVNVTVPFVITYQ